MTCTIEQDVANISQDHIEQRMAALSEHMKNVIQQYLQNHYESINQYNAIAGEIEEPHRILVVIGFPERFSREAIRLLNSIISNGPRCGVTTLLVINTDKHLPAEFNLKDLHQFANVIVWNGQNFALTHTNFGTIELYLDTLPPLDIFSHLLQQVGQEALRNKQKVEIPFKKIIERHVPQLSWWDTYNSASEEVLSLLGRISATKYQYIQLGKNFHHMLLVGETGFGKTNLLNVFIVSLALTYSPEEIEFYLVDFKTVGFAPYALYKLPHARVIAIQSQPDFGLSVLEGLDTELERRKKLFSHVNVDDISLFRKTQPGRWMPRIFLIIDEFQELFTRKDRVSREAVILLDRLVRTGRGFGIHVVLSTQTLAGIPMLYQSTISQMAIRIALRCKETDFSLVLSKDNSLSRLLPGFRKGQAIYNDGGGVEGPNITNNIFQCALLSNDHLSVYLNAIQQLAQSRNYIPTQEQIIFDGSKHADIIENRQFKNLLTTLGWPKQQGLVDVWLGKPVALRELIALQFLPRAGQNLLIVGEQEEVALGLLTIILFTLCTHYAPQDAQFYLLDLRSDTPYINRVRQRELSLPHLVKVANHRQTASFITDISKQLESRRQNDEERKVPLYFFICGLQNAHDLRLEEQLIPAGLTTSPSLGEYFTTILSEGPILNIHTLLWCDTLNHIKQSLKQNVLFEFDKRLVFEMSSKDSEALMASPIAHTLGPYRALYKDGFKQVETFIPYGPPSDEWLVWAVDQLRDKKRE